jgi:hypothetical protein
MAIDGQHHDFNSDLQTLLISRGEHGDNIYHELFEEKYSNYNLLISEAYFEDYTLFAPYIDTIRSWFPKTYFPKNEKDVVLHLRLQNRLITKNHLSDQVTLAGYEKILEQFDFECLHIVTDASQWEPYTAEDIELILQQMKENNQFYSKRAPMEASLDYINSLIKGFEKYKPIVHFSRGETIKHSTALKANFIEDFNLIRSFDKIIVHNSTFSWWAAVLSDASQVKVFEPWKPSKGIRNKNLGRTNYPNWTSWGTEEDLYDIVA